MTEHVRDNSAAHRFELVFDGTAAFIAYRKAADIVTLVHTEVPEALAGRGVGSKLAKGALELLKEAGAKVVPECPFVAAYIDKHPEFQALVAGPGDEKLDARLDEALTETFPASDPTAVSTRR